ncbi:hypothetical protein K458DRAFT_394435 [Lentithecium fluviatile CBS 122367]|uniref:Uncharacterized protein n=1 Tax=Lentithecium fluviatile CBS 122367 TaxID=1168545 RepID=A0A6G1ILB4_9PLEO|nr:hypothetical protein K458DRAFT_394435 [Lentithecium fluviatile CBS 122367]
MVVPPSLTPPSPLGHSRFTFSQSFLGFRPQYDSNRQTQVLNRVLPGITVQFQRVFQQPLWSRYHQTRTPHVEDTYLPPKAGKHLFVWVKLVEPPLRGRGTFLRRGKSEPSKRSLPPLQNPWLDLVAHRFRTISLVLGVRPFCCPCVSDLAVAPSSQKILEIFK